MTLTAETLIYQPKNLLLMYPNDWYIKKETLKAVKGSIQPIVDFYEGSGTKKRKNTDKWRAGLARPSAAS